MDREKQIAHDLETLRSLCDEAISREECRRRIDSLAGHTFLEPEHAIVFESIRALFPRGPIQAERLRIHLTNRGFPDTDVEKYFHTAPQASFPESAGKIRP